MSDVHTDTSPTDAVSSSDAMFTPLERTVLALADREQGRGLLPATGFGRFVERLSARLFARHGVQPLADPRLEALRSFVNALQRCGRSRVEQATAALRSAGFEPLQEVWIRSTFARCA